MKERRERRFRFISNLEKDYFFICASERRVRVPAVQRQTLSMKASQGETEVNYDTGRYFIRPVMTIVSHEFVFYVRYKSNGHVKS